MAPISDTGAAPGGAGPEPGWLPPITLPVHPLTRYLRVRLEVTEGVLRWEVPRALLGLIPTGTHHIRVPVGDVRSTRVRLALHPLHLLAGGAGIMLPLACGLGWLSAPPVIIGAWAALTSFGLHIEVTTGGGGRHRAGVCYFHRVDAELYAAAVNDLVRPATIG